MNAFSRTLQLSPERPIDPHTLEILELIDRIFQTASVDYMLVGATARDLLLYHVFGQATIRATYDLDFAVLVESWEHFAAVKRALLETAGFVDRRGNLQRLYYEPPGTSFESVIDVIPFGKLESPDRTIAWPPSGDVVMNVAAFTDVLTAQ
jgi:predicted nucleotidyltransferase